MSPFEPNGLHRTARRALAAVAAAAFGLLSGGSAPAQAETPPLLRIDPFRPRPAVIPPAASTPEIEIFVPVLRSTVVAGERSLANLGGEILSPGQEAHGYRLVEVRAFDALFIHNGQPVRLDVVSSPAAPAPRYDR